MSLTYPTRRRFVQSTSAVGLGLSLPMSSFAETPSNDRTHQVTLGVIADLHGGFAEDATQRLGAFLNHVGEHACDALLQLGDFAYANKDHQDYAKRFNEAHDTTLHVIGNHEFDYGLTREDCYTIWGMESSFYRRDVHGVRFLVLDGNEKGSPTHKGGYPSYVGEQQLEWLANELSSSDRPVVIVSHQPLAGVWSVDNASDVQELLGKHHERIIVCLNGHSHVDSLISVDGVRYLHVNSASYFWVGGKARMAYYQDPLFTTIMIDPTTKTVSVAGRTSKWRTKSPQDLNYFDRPDRPSQDIVRPEIRQRRLPG